MNIGLYQSAASLSALERWQDAVAQNITSSQTTGYRKRTVNFTTEEAGKVLDGGHGNVTRNGMPMLFPKVQSGINYTSGETEVTKRDLDVAIQGDGFFEVQNADGTHAYTRNGEFHLRSDRTLTTGDGAVILNDGGSPIQTLPAGGDIVINRDGTMSQNGTTLGRLAVKKFTDESTLVPSVGGRFTAPAGTTATQVTDPELAQGSLEGSNVMALREMVDLVSISRAYEANQKIVTTADEEMGKTLDALG